MQGTEALRFASRPGFLRIWLSFGSYGAASGITQVALSWSMVEITGSAVGVGAMFAARLAPSLVLGIPAGVLADRSDRRRLVLSVNAAAAFIALGAAAGAFSGRLDLAIVLLSSVLFGAVDTFRTPAAQAYIYDIVGDRDATSGIAMANLGVLVASSIGSALGGASIALSGVASAYLVAAGGCVVALALMTSPVRHRRSTIRVETTTLRRAATLVVRNRVIGALMALVLVAEILGFSSAALLPSFATDVLLGDAAGLGFLFAARGLGGALGLGWLVAARRDQPGRLMLGSAIGLSAGLVAFGLSRSLAVSLLVSVGIGAAAAILDTLGQSLMQRAVADEERGAAMGLWVVAIGVGPLGFIGIGVAASQVGAPAAQVSSAVLLLLGTALIGTGSRIRRLT